MASLKKCSILMKFQIEKSTIYPDISVISDEEFSNFREEYDYYKNVITQVLDKSIAKTVVDDDGDNIGCVEKIEFRELVFSTIPERATLKALVVVGISKEYINKIEGEYKWHHFFGTMLGTSFRMKSPYAKHKARFIVL